MKKDITTEEDIKCMVDSFYAKVNLDPKLSAIFNDFSQVDWDQHLPRMYGFWNTLLLGKQEYKGSPFDKHLPLPVDKSHFDRWIQLFEETIDEHFEGDVAQNTKLRAQSIAHVFRSKIEYIRSSESNTQAAE